MTDPNATDPFDALTAALGILGTPRDALRFDVRDAIVLLQSREADLGALEGREPEDADLVEDVFGVLLEDLDRFDTLPASEAVRFAGAVAVVVETIRLGAAYLAECEEDALVADLLEDLERDFGDVA